MSDPNCMEEIGKRDQLFQQKCVMPDSGFQERWWPRLVETLSKKRVRVIRKLLYSKKKKVKEHQE